MIENLTQEEIQAVKFYIGDCTGYEQHPFWGESRAYLVLNSLFFDGIRTEQARVAEGKFLNPEIVADPERLENLLRTLLSAFRKSWNTENFTTYRVERFSDYQAMKCASRTISFTSTSLNYFLKAYQDRTGIALMRFEIPAHTPCIHMQEFLQDYAKPEEAEILLPPFLNLHFEEIPVSDDEKKILDSEKNPPVCSCVVTVQELKLPDNPKNPGIKVKDLKKIYSALNCQNEISQEEIKFYTEWKKSLIYKILH